MSRSAEVKGTVLILLTPDGVKDTGKSCEKEHWIP